MALSLINICGETIINNPKDMSLLNYDDARGMIYDKKLERLRKMTKKEKAKRFLDEAIGKNYVDELLGKVLSGSGTNFKNLLTTCS